MPGPCALASAATRMPTWPPWNSKRASQLCQPSFFERILRVRAGDPRLRPPPADPQPLERVPDGLITDPLGRDPVLGADLGGQGQGPGGAGLAELPRALVQERLQPLAALGIEELGGVVRSAGLHGYHRQPAGLEGPQDVAHRLRTAPDGLGDY